MNDEIDFEKAKEDALQKDQRLQFEREDLGGSEGLSSVFSSSSTKVIECTYCYKSGHVESECRKKMRDLRNGSKSGEGKNGKKGKNNK
jgi:hypothetical protein